MRISDWSSDVCSSDLGECNDLAAIQGEICMTKNLMRPKRKRHIAESQLAIECGRELAARDFAFTACIVDHFVDGGEAAFGGIHVLQFLQIGSASCRERGWQYV